MGEKRNILFEKSIEFSVRIIRLYEFLTKDRNNYVIPKQILASGTSIGAQLAESKGAQSDADFIAKLHISLKEANETQYWLVLLSRTDYIKSTEFESLNNDLKEIIALLTTALKSTKARIQS